MAISNHLTKRGGAWQYVRRVPADLRDSFPLSRIQKSLRTSIDRQAREAALDLDRLWDRRFAEVRERGGRACENGGLPVISTGDLT
ncbi:DUF6538 domain-containing protein [Fulvimarina manganoxydans]|uniref:DUF6538 domain-containing protein n=1 Tax=Fulvimarina manganoxydans TaxID=937218 RepID=UPI003CC80872